MAISTATRNQLLDKLLRAVDFTPASTVYVSLHSADPGLTGANEISAAGRKAISFAAASGGSVQNNALIEFTSMPAATVTHVGLWSAASGGSLLWGGAVSASKTFGAGDTCQIKASSLTAGLT